MAIKRKRTTIKSEPPSNNNNPNRKSSSSSSTYKSFKSVKTPRGKYQRGAPAWTAAQDEFLMSQIREQDEHGRRRWNLIHDAFVKVFPDAGKSLKAIKCRYEQHLKGSTVELEGGEKELFRRAVDEIDNNRVRMEAIAWRFGVLAKREITKNGAAKLVKQMGSWK